MSEELEEEKKIEGEIETVIDQNRVINFSDAVFAFAATLLVLKIDIPQLSGIDMNTQLVQTLINMWPEYLANIISFLVIGYYWLNHHAIFGLLKRFNSTIVWINIIFLISVSFIPFPVDLYGDFPTTPIVVVFYSLSLAVVGYLLALIWWYASYNNRLIDRKMSKRRINYYRARTLVAPFVFTFAIPLVYIHPIVAQFSWLLVIIGVVLVNKVFKYKKLSEIDKAVG